MLFRSPQKRIAIRAESVALRVYVMHLDLIGFTHKLEQFRAIITHWTAQKLDAIYAGGAVGSTHRAWTLNLRASDHLPVLADF